MDAAAPDPFLERKAEEVRVLNDVLFDAADTLLRADSSADALAALDDSRTGAMGVAALATDAMDAMHDRLVAAGIMPAEVIAFSQVCAYQGAALLLVRLAQVCIDSQTEVRFDAVHGEVAGHA